MITNMHLNWVPQQDPTRVITAKSPTKYLTKHRN